MNNKILWSFFAIFIVSVATFAGITYAYKGDPTVQGPNYDAAVHEQLEAAIDAGDYNAWLQIRKDNNLPMNGKIFQVINEDNFDKYAELHKAALAGDTETVNAIRAELGLGQGSMKQGSGRMSGSGTGSGNRQGTGQNFIDANNDGICDGTGRN